MDYTKLMKVIGYSFGDLNLLETASTHSSFVHEHRNKAIKTNKSLRSADKTEISKKNFVSNERLEFLGDAVLEIIISDYIYINFPDMPEGEMTKFRASIVCASSLAKASKRLDLGSYLKLGKGEEQTGGRTRDSILADAFEAMIGAIYVDGGLEPAKKFILDELSSAIVQLENNYELVDCKTYLQEYIQKTSKVPIVYTIIEESGPEHDKVFVSQITHMENILGTGKGKSKKEAEQEAAKNSLERLKKQM